MRYLGAIVAAAIVAAILYVTLIAPMLREQLDTFREASAALGA